MTPTDLYFLLHTGNEGDIDFYANQASGARAVLEIGCGDGRILRHLLAPGRRVVGVEKDPLFAERARCVAPAQAMDRVDPQWASPTVHEADVRELAASDLAASGRFDAVFIPYNTVYALGGEAGVVACARLCAAVAHPGATLWLDVYPVDEFHELALCELPPEDDDEPLVELMGPRGRYRVTEHTDIDPEQKRLAVTYRASPVQGAAVELVLHHDYVLLARLEELFATAGWQPMTRRWGFADDQDDPLVLGFRRSGTPQP